MLDKHLRRALRMPEPPKNPYAALLQPMVIVPHDAAQKPVIADAGSIVRLADQTNLYRNHVSPVTRRADELLVVYGAPKKAQLGWLSQKFGPKAMAPSKGPTFLVTTRDDSATHPWDLLRLLVARSRGKDSSQWVGSWLPAHPDKLTPRQLREVTRFFGGTPKQNEGFDVRCTRLLSLILKTEFDMASTKKAAKKSARKEPTKAKKAIAKSASKSKPAKKSRVSNDRITREYDEHIIRRLVKENPRRAGSEKAKIWDKLRKGMTVSEFVAKGGSRGAVKKYIENGWAKLLKPRASDDAE